jgi:hypothetical protein
MHNSIFKITFKNWIGKNRNYYIRAKNESEASKVFFLNKSNGEKILKIEKDK